MIIDALVAAVSPWHDWYAHSKATSAAVNWVHLSALLVGGGMAIASDRMVLRVGRANADDRRRTLSEFSAIHRPVLLALAVAALSGVAQTLADVQTYFVSPTYWIKMGLIALLLLNAWALARTAKALLLDPSPGNRRWKRLTGGAVASIMLWLGTTLAGVLLTNA